MDDPTSAAAPLGPGVAVEVETDLGPLWAEKGAPLLTEALSSMGTWDPTVSGLIRTALFEGATFVDAGANIGYFTVMASRQVGPQGRVFAIEPDPVNLAILRANLDRHSCSNVTVLPVAAWHERAELNLMRPPEDGAVTRVGMAEGGGELIRATPLDDVVTGRVDYLKVDTELTDHIVVQGARRILRDNPSMLITVEFHPWEATHTGESPADVLEVYKGLGLVPFVITPPGDGVMPTSWEQISDPDLREGQPCFDFAMSREMPARLLYAQPLAERVAVRILGRKGLERAGDLLDHVPKRIRPRVRHRDRRPPGTP